MPPHSYAYMEYMYRYNIQVYMFCILTKTLYQANQYYEKCVCSKIHLNRNCIRIPAIHYNIEPFIEAGFYSGTGGVARF